MRRTIFIMIFGFTLFSSARSQSSIQQEVDAYTDQLPFPMKKVNVPSFPPNTVSIKSYGAIADAVTMNTDAINAAILACVKMGGGTVVVPAGAWLSGPIQLASNINLHLEEGAMLLFSCNVDTYPLYLRPKSNTYRHMPMIYGVNLENVALTGSGVLNGNGQYWRMVKKEKLNSRQWADLVKSGGVVSADGKIWWPSNEAMTGEKYLKGLYKTDKKPDEALVAKAREYLRPTMLEFDVCKNVLIDGPTFTNPPAWTVSPVQCENVVIRDMKITNEWWWQNSDGVDIAACKNVIFYKNVISAGDDAICLKPSSPKKKGTVSCENIVIADCTVFHGHGGFVIGSESYGGAQNISVKNLTCVGTDVGLRFKSTQGRGGRIEKIYVDGVHMKDILGEAVLFDMSYDGDKTIDVSDQTRIPVFRDFHLQNIVCDGATDAMVIHGETNVPIFNIELKNSTFVSNKGFSFQNADTVSVSGVTVKLKKSPLVWLKDAKNISLQQVHALTPPDVYLHVEGALSQNIRIMNADAANSKKIIELGKGSAKNCVTAE